MIVVFIYSYLHIYVELNLQAIEATMDAAEDQFIPLSELTLSTHRRRVRVRISRMWLSFNPNDNDRVIGLDSLLIDDQVTTHSLTDHRFTHPLLLSN